MKHVSLLCLLSAGAFAVPTIVIEGVPARTDAATLDFDVVVTPDGFPDYAPVVEVAGPSALTPTLRTTPAADATRFEYRVELAGAMPGRYQVLARTPGPDQQNIYVSEWFVYRFIPAEPVVRSNVKDGDVVGPIFWLSTTCESCGSFSAPPQGWVSLDAFATGDGRYMLHLGYTATDGTYRPPIELNLRRGPAKVAPPADPEVPREGESCAVAGGAGLPLLALLWLWRRRAAIALGLTLSACPALPPAEVLRAGEGAENTGALWPAHVGWQYGEYRIIDRRSTERGDEFFLQHRDSGGQTYLEDDQGIWLVGSEYTGELERPLLVAPKKTKLGASWRTRAKLNTPPNLGELWTLSTSDVWQMSVVANDEVPTPWGRRRLWIIEWVGPPRVGLLPTSIDEDAPQTMPRLRGTYAFVEGVGPITFLPNLGWPKESFHGAPATLRGDTDTLTFNEVLRQLDDRSTWALPGAVAPDLSDLPQLTLGEPLFQKEAFSAGGSGCASTGRRSSTRTPAASTPKGTPAASRATTRRRGPSASTSRAAR